MTEFTTCRSHRCARDAAYVVRNTQADRVVMVLCTPHFKQRFNGRPLGGAIEVEEVSPAVLA